MPKGMEDKSGIRDGVAQPIRIGLVAEYFPPHALGGAEWSSYYLAQGLALRGHRVVVATPDFTGQGSRIEVREPNLTIVYFPFPVRVQSGKKAGSFWMENPLLTPLFAGRVEGVLRDYNIEIAHAINKYSAPWAAIAAGRMGIPWLVTFRDYFSHCPLSTCLRERDYYPDYCGWSQYGYCLSLFEKESHSSRGLPFRLKYRLHGCLARAAQLWRLHYLHRADAIVTVSDRVREIYAATGVNANLVAIHTPLESDELPPLPEGGVDESLVLYVGKISPGKGVDRLVRAFADLAREDEELRLALAGDGPIREALEADVKALGMADRIVFKGRVSHEDVQALYRKAAVTVVPSVWQEPFPRVILESYFAGTPVVASRRGGNPEAVEDGVTGYLVEPDADEIRDGIARAIRNPALRRNVIAARPEYVRRFREDVFRRHEDLYLQLIARKSGIT